MADQLLLQLLSTCRQHVSTGDRMEKTHEDLATIHADLKQLNALAGKSSYSLRSMISVLTILLKAISKAN